jgi:hypothetical protein
MLKHHQSVKVKASGMLFSGTIVSINGFTVTVTFDHDCGAYKKGDKLAVRQWECSAVVSNGAKKSSH